MSNLFTGSPWFIDTVMTTIFPQPPSNVFIREIVWDEQVGAGDQLVILDGNGRTLVDSKASAANVYQRWGQVGFAFGGIKVTVLTSGKVMVYIK